VPTLGKREAVELFVEKLLKSQARRKTCCDNNWVRIAASTEIGVIGYHEKYAGDAFDPVMRQLLFWVGIATHMAGEDTQQSPNIGRPLPGMEKTR
jgi:hypothetical protein